jgi:DNA-binding Lrp family transcriptional regulator
VQNGQPDAFDRRLVHALLIAPRAPFRQLAAVLGVSDQTVRRRYASLGSALGLRVLGRLDSSLVGRVDWILRLRCTPDAAARIAQLQRAGALYFDVDLDERVLGSVISAELWISAEPSALTAVGTAIAAHSEVPFAGATTGPTNLLASVVCTDTGQLYRYLTTQIGELAGVRHVETAPTIRTLKRAGSLVPG